MKSLSLFLATALLPLALADTPAEVPILHLLEEEPATYERADRESCAQLHDACRRCASIDFLYAGAPQFNESCPRGLDALALIMQDSLDYNQRLAERLRTLPEHPSLARVQELVTEMTGALAQLEQSLRELAPAVGEKVSEQTGYDTLMSAYRWQNLRHLADIHAAVATIELPQLMGAKIPMAFSRITYKDPARLHRDTQRRMRSTADDMRQLMADYLALLPLIVDAPSAAEHAATILQIKRDYADANRLLSQYQQDDPEGAGDIIEQLQQDFRSVQEQMQPQEARLREQGYFRSPSLRALYE